MGVKARNYKNYSSNLRKYKGFYFIGLVLT